MSSQFKIFWDLPKAKNPLQKPYTQFCYTSQHDVIPLQQLGKSVHSHLFLSLYDVWEFGVGYSGIEFALHQRGSLVVFDVTKVAALRHFDVFGEALPTKIGVNRWSCAEVKQKMTREAGESEGEWLELYLFLEVADGVFVSIS